MRLTDADRLLEIMEERTKPEFGSDGSKDRYRYMQWVADYHAIKSAPTVDAVEAQHGRWIRVRDPSEILMNYYVCDKCGNMEACESNYCPHCGARMKGASDEAD